MAATGLALNMLDRSMGRDDLYPFVLPPPSAHQDAVAAVAQVHCRLVHILPGIRTFHATQELRRSACCMVDVGGAKQSVVATLIVELVSNKRSYESLEVESQPSANNLRRPKGLDRWTESTAVSRV